MAAREIQVTPAELDAARTLVELADELGLPVSDITRTIANTSVHAETVKASVTIGTPVIHVESDNEGSELQPS
jgi:hypothetical protein